MMGLNFGSFTFLVMHQANMVAISTIYGEEMTVYFYLGQGFSNLFISAMRLIFIQFDLSPKLDVKLFAN